jgi:hypothetical protein
LDSADLWQVIDGNQGGLHCSFAGQRLGQLVFQHLTDFAPQQFGFATVTKPKGRKKIAFFYPL